MRDITAVVFVAALAATVESGDSAAPKTVFVVFEEVADFAEARSICDQLEGRLATFASSESNLSRLGLDSGWIGLHRPTGCPDPAATLRGYEWLRGGVRSDFQNWDSGFDLSCSSPRCVVVDEQMKWLQRNCSSQASGLICEYPQKQTCGPLAEAHGVTYRLFGRTARHFSSGVPRGFIATREPDSTQFMCFREQWVQAPWNCEILEGGCQHRCSEHPDSSQPFCYCPPGSSIDPENGISCSEDPSDPCLSLLCDHGCFELGGTHSCLCHQGFKLGPDGRTCTDFNDCVDERQCPEDNTVCVNVPGGFQCHCKAGYHRSAGQCVDVNECASAPCEHICTNVPGNYSCSCYDGYRPDPESPDKCKLHCGMEECPAECDPNNKYQCYCPDGYILEERVDEMICIDINECEFFYCDQDCTNSFGGFTCFCKDGWTLVDQYKCVKNEDYDTDSGGSGVDPTAAAVTTASYVPDSSPTARPSGVSVGGFVGIIISTVLITSLVVFALHHCLNKREDARRNVKAAEPESHSLGAAR
ncbi:thrombomodulin-like [Neosynchiropus ocellatus]